MGSLGVVELQGPGEGVEDLFGDPGEVSPLEPDVVVGADTGEEGDLLAAQSGDAALVAEDATWMNKPPAPAWCSSRKPSTNGTLPGTCA